jgi:hypothetical protein
MTHFPCEFIELSFEGYIYGEKTDYHFSFGGGVSVVCVVATNVHREGQVGDGISITPPELSQAIQTVGRAASSWSGDDG